MMTLTKFSRSRIMLSASHWDVPADYFDVLCNYLVHGFQPGSFWTAAVANDFARAVLASHPSNQIAVLKNTVGWIRDSWPAESYGSYESVQAWVKMSDLDRRCYLEQHRLVYTEQEEIVLALSGKTAMEVPLYWDTSYYTTSN